jgi:hypothetical protein
MQQAGRAQSSNRLGAEELEFDSQERKLTHYRNALETRMKLGPVKIARSVMPIHVSWRRVERVKLYFSAPYMKSRRDAQEQG